MEEKVKDNFVHLHLHSTYSFVDGYGLPEQYIDRAVEIGQPGCGVTDHGNISVHYKWYKECTKKGIKPILGCEFYLVQNTEDVHTREYNHITVLVKNNVGYRNLTKLVTKAWTEQFYYKPRITWEQLFSHQEGLIVLSGCLSSPVMKLLRANMLEEAYWQLKMFKGKIEDFYIEVQPIHFEEGKPAYERLIELYNTRLRKEGFKWVATNDCHYVCKEHNKIQEILLCIQSNDSMSNPDRWKFDQDDFYLKTRKEMEGSLKECFPTQDFTDALDNTVKIMESVDFQFPTATPIKYPMVEEDKLQYIYDLCHEGMKKRGLAGIKEYEERLEYELDLIVKKNFIDYFLVIADMTQWAKSSGILVGPARGSAAGSLACYVLAITEVEPIKYGLIFERFIDLNREDLPDIDMDFEDARRHEVKEYLEQKYGRDRVGNLPVFAAFKGKSAIDDVARVFKIPFGVTEKVKQAIIERSGGDSRASFTLMDTFESTVFDYPKEAMKMYPELIHAVELEGQLRQMGQHAAGVVISNEPLTNFCALYKVKESYVTSLDYKDASSIGLLKIDILGLNTLSVISKTLRSIKERHNIDIDIYNLPLDDKKVYDSFCEGKLFGVFQFDGQAVNQVCRQILPHNFETLSAISALARPGPLNSGSTTMYIQRRAGKQKVEYPHPVMKPYTEETYGIVVYQEQVMKTMRELGKMSWKDTSEIRKLISRSQGVEKFNTFKDKFSLGAAENGMNNEQIDKVWDSICTFGSWAFNKSHSVSYTLISYWTMWLKVNYPMEFYGAILSLTEHDDKKKKILKEYKREGYKVLGVDINKSKDSFTIEEGGLRIGFSDINGIGPIASKKLVELQPYRSYDEFLKKTQGKRITSKIRDALINLGAFDELSDVHEETLFGTVSLGCEKQELDFSTRFKLCPWDVEFGIEDKWLGYIRQHPETFSKDPIPIEQLKQDENGGFSEDVTIYGIVYDKNLRDAREVSMSKGKDFDIAKYDSVKIINPASKEYNKYMSKRSFEFYEKKLGRKLTEGVDYIIEPLYQFANFVVEDDTDFITVRMSHLIFPEFGKLIFSDIQSDDVVVIKGKMGAGIRMFFANKVLCLRHHKDKLSNNKN